ncbi:hypothetical protein R6Q57_014383 [Mikania cordata]
MDESENKTKGNSQKRKNFWKKVTVSWHRVMGFDAEYRTYRQLNSKWKDMCPKLTKFSGIYSNCANNRKSGMSDENVLKWAEKEYQLKDTTKRASSSSRQSGYSNPATNELADQLQAFTSFQKQKHE